MGLRIAPDTDEVQYKGQILKPIGKQYYILMNKPKDFVTTLNDPEGRRTVAELIKDDDVPRVFPVGRLDRMTTGLLLLTNDGDLAQKLSHPSYKIKKIYHVKLDRNVKPADIDKIAAGLDLEDGKAVVDKVAYMMDCPPNEVGVELHSGKNRIVRRIFEHLGYEVEKLDRIYYGGLTKKDLRRGWWRHLTEQEVVMLKHFTGSKSGSGKELVD
jgi:23S rRNA pseudouridine2605 synthase